MDNPEKNQKRIELIEAMPNLDRGDKRALLLICLGLKKVSDLVLSKDDKRKEQKKDEFEGMGFYCDWADALTEDHVELRITDSPESLARIQAAKNTDDITWGELSGYPQTAIEAFASGDESQLLPFEEIPDDIKNTEWFELLNFRLSRAHWQKELETVKNWYIELKKHAPAFLDEYIRHNKEYRAWYEAELKRQREQTAKRVSDAQ